MRKRDLGILLLSAFALFLSLQNEGTFSFREEWHHELDQSLAALNDAEKLPQPITADLNGDGHSEIVTVTHDSKLQVLEPGARVKGGSFRPTVVRAEASLLPARVRVATGRTPVALGAGCLDQATGRQRRNQCKQVVVVVTAGWSILCFDHNLRLLWENNVKEEWPHGSHHKEVAVLITNHTMMTGDRGVIIVGGSMEVAPQKDNPFANELEAERAAGEHRRSAQDAGLEDVSAGSEGVKERHFSYYAYAGNSGALRWKHDSKDFHRDLTAASDQLTPQHNYKLDATSLNTRHYGEVECRQFRESVLAAMPHRWDRREDTRLDLAHFERSRRPTSKRQPGQSSDASKAHGQDRSNPVSKLVGRTVDAVTSGKQARANLTRMDLLPRNAIIAHLKEGIEAVHLYSGHTICKLHLPPHALHADINGDGVLDHVQATGGHSRLFVPPGADEPMKPCWAVATSGTPPREQLFNGSICRGGSLLDPHFTSRTFGRGADAVVPLEVVTPVLLPRPDGHLHIRGSKGDAVFLTSRGEVTAYDSVGLYGNHGNHAHQRWQVTTPASWANPLVPLGMHEEKVVPTLAALPLLRRGLQEVILAAGETHAVWLSPAGTKLTTLELPAAPNEPLQIADFNDDGLNDLILSSRNGYYGFAQVRQPGAILFRSLLGCLIVGMGIIFLIQHMNEPKGEKVHRRSTD